MSERGSVSLVVAAALAVAVLLAGFTADLSGAASAGARAQAAADAAALAAAQELVFPSGDAVEDVARDYAERNGAQLVTCRCGLGRDDVVVEVEVTASLSMFGGSRGVRRSARAVVGEADGLQGLVPFFAASVTCLLSRIPGTNVVSGFRTTAEQARLYREKPGLAAPPGRSLHERGLAADLGFPSAAAERRAHRLAPSCGLRFPIPYEPWHAEPIAPAPR